MAVTLATDADFQSYIGSNERVIVKYFAGWCGSCKLFSPKFRRMSEEEKNKNILFLDIDAENNPEARKTAGVSNLPFFATFVNGDILKADFTAKEETVEKMIEEIRV